jgi:hypothetical protein
MDDDTLQELEFQLLYGHSYPCALDMFNVIIEYPRPALRGRIWPLHSDRWLYGKRYMRRSWQLGKQDGTTLIAVMLN